MKKFENVSVDIEGNSYFDGAVTSRTVYFADGSKKTLGFMLAGEYEFNSELAELMEISSGSLDVMLPELELWTPISGGDSFSVPANSKFKVKVHTTTDYCCSYIA